MRFVPVLIISFFCFALSDLRDFAISTIPLPAQFPPFAASAAYGAESAPASGIRFLTRAEFQDLAIALASKVNLFKAAWDQDPTAEFTGGTTRDFLYWIKGQFRDVKSVQEARAKINSLKAIPIIDIREFVVGDSDVDITSRSAHLDPKKYGVQKIDSISPDRFNLNTEMGKNERDQGYLPTEKIRLSRKGFIPWEGFGDGIGEIFSGRVTVHFSDPKLFSQTFYAKQKLNHPILMAIRYVRALAINYYQSYGQGLPEDKILFDIDPQSEKQLSSVIEKTLQGHDLPEYLKQDRFKKWLNGSIQKSFRSYTNPTAAYELFKRYHLDQLVARYSAEIEPINQYLFAKKYDPEIVAANFKKYKINPKDVFVDPAKEFPGLNFYHGTRRDEAFYAILRQGVLPSSGGTAGPGLYGVNETNRGFSEHWGGKKENLVRFKVDPSARIVDITQGAGKRLFEKFGGSHEDFARAFGADILAYPYQPTAYVVENSQVLQRPEGVYRKILTIAQVRELGQGVKTPEELLDFLHTITLSQLNSEETAWVMSGLEYRPSVAEYVKTLGSSAFSEIPQTRQIEIAQRLIAKLSDPPLTPAAKEAMGEEILKGDYLPQWIFDTSYLGLPMQQTRIAQELIKRYRLLSITHFLQNYSDIAEKIPSPIKEALLGPARIVEQFNTNTAQWNTPELKKLFLQMSSANSKIEPLLIALEKYPPGSAFWKGFAPSDVEQQYEDAIYNIVSESWRGSDFAEYVLSHDVKELSLYLNVLYRLVETREMAAFAAKDILLKPGAMVSPLGRKTVAAAAEKGTSGGLSFCAALMNSRLWVEDPFFYSVAQKVSEQEPNRSELPFENAEWAGTERGWNLLRKFAKNSPLAVLKLLASPQWQKNPQAIEVLQICIDHLPEELAPHGGDQVF